jgi:cytochrome c oxidase cbb3-type subunit 3
MARRDDDRLVGHAYDGIQEYDNPLPGWWVWIFVATIVFSAAYWGYYQLGPGSSVVAEYEAEARIASERAAALAAREGAQSDETIVAVARDAGVMAKAKEAFVARCAVCHGPQGQGLIGPNLTDEYWLHGGRPTDIFRIISDGEVEKGMVPWKGVLAPQEIRALAAYIGTLRGSNPPNPKPPQGDRVAASGTGAAGR